MLEKTKSYEINNCSQENVQTIMDNLLRKNLNFNTRIVKLGKNIIKINYYESYFEESFQKANKILILQDPDNNCHINFQGTLTENQILELWNELNQNLGRVMDPNTDKEEPLTKDEAIFKIIEGIEREGYNIDTMDAIEFIEKFQLRYVRYPYYNEIKSIIKSYILSQSSDDMTKEQVNIKKDTNKKSDFVQFNDDKSVLNSNNIDNNVITPPRKLSETSSTIKTISKPRGRRKCPMCSNFRPNSIHESEDKTNIIMTYPKLYGKIFKCGECGQEWREQ